MGSQSAKSKADSAAASFTASVLALLDCLLFTEPIIAIKESAIGFFAIAVYGLHLMETYPVKQKPVQTIQSLALEEYQRCLISYDRDLVFKNRKMTEEQLCSNLNVIYKKQVLSNVKTK